MSWPLKFRDISSISYRPNVTNDVGPKYYTSACVYMLRAINRSAPSADRAAQSTDLLMAQDMLHAGDTFPHSADCQIVFLD